MSPYVLYFTLFTSVALITVSAVDKVALFLGKKGWVLENAFDNYPPEKGGMGKYDQSYNVSRECYDDMLVYLDGLLAGREWATRMLDSDGDEPGGPRPPGLIDGNSHWLGSWEECMGVTATQKPGSPELMLHDWDSKYCRCRYGPKETNSYSFGVCVPSTCSEEDVSHLVVNNITDPIIETYCGKNKDFSTDAGAIITTIILCVFGTIILLATSVHYIGSQNKASGLDTGDAQNARTHNQPKDSVESTNHTPAGMSNIPLKLKGEVLDEERAVGEGSVSNAQATNTFSLQESTPEPGKWWRTLSTFSLLGNVPRILSTKQPKGTYTCMHGVRFFSMTWIVLGHTWVLGTYILPDPSIATLENPAIMYRMMGRWTHAAINNMSLAVESFFLLSGGLITISLMKQFTRLREDNSGKKQVAKSMGLYYFHRYWRLTPVYAAVLMIYGFYFHYFEQGPLWPRTIADADNCRHNWWTNLLYINNLVNIHEPCMGHSWYLANDFQFYVFTPVFVFFLFRFPIFGYVFLTLGYAGQLFATAWLTSWSARNSYSLNWYVDIYIRPWCRFGPYAIGIALGYILWKTKSKVKMPRVAVVFGWILASTLCLLAVYGGVIIDSVSCEGCVWSRDLKFAYESIYRDLFALGIAWLVFACCTGYGGIVNNFLSWRFFVPLSRLTYVGYLCHPMIIYYTMFSRMRVFYVQDSTMAVLFSGFLLMTFGASFVLSLMFEVPMLELEKVWLPRK